MAALGRMAPIATQQYDASHKERSSKVSRTRFYRDRENVADGNGARVIDRLLRHSRGALCHSGRIRS